LIVMVEAQLRQTRAIQANPTEFRQLNRQKV
jgi:hypothetical protein